MGFIELHSRDSHVSFGVSLSNMLLHLRFLLLKQ